MKFLILSFLILLSNLTFAQSGVSRFHLIEDTDFPHESLRLRSYVKKVFDPKLPTILFFVGGPGASTWSTEFHVDDFNVIFFEQRGMGSSRPDSKEVFLNPKFYSSLKTAHDGRTILKDYGLKKAFIYGHSYGTIPATMFASLYPEMTEKLILEGTIFRADKNFWRSELRRKKLQEFFESLSSEQKALIIDVSSQGLVPASWFSVVGMMMSYLDNGLEAYRAFLSTVLAMDAETFSSLIETFYTPKGFLKVNPENASDGEIVFGMITCQELSGSSPFASQSLIFDENRKLVWEEHQDIKKSYCDPLVIEAQRSIDLTQFPVHIPVIYFSGKNDGATDFDQAKNHFQTIPQGKKEMYVHTSGGHLPNLGALRENRECESEEDCGRLEEIKKQVAMFKNILLGTTVDLSPEGPWEIFRN